MPKPLLIALAILVILLFTRFLIGGSEDTWICSNGKWVRHGNPSTAMPAEPCR